MKVEFKWLGITILILIILLGLLGTICFNILTKHGVEIIESQDESMLDNTNSIIENHVYQMNLKCPIEKPFIKVTHLCLEDSFVVYNVITTLEKNNYNIYSKIHGRFVELGLYVKSDGNYSDKYLETLTDNGYGIKIKAITNKQDSLNTITLTTEDLLSTKNYVKRFPEIFTEEYISLFISLQNRFLPMDIGDGMILSSIIIEKGYFIYQLILDNSYSINHIKNIKSHLKRSILNNIITLPEYETILNVCNLVKYGIKHRLIVEHENDSIDFQFDYNEIQEAINIYKPKFIK